MVFLFTPNSLESDLQLGKRVPRGYLPEAILSAMPVQISSAMLGWRNGSTSQRTGVSHFL
jgi:hypothetical protein